MDNELLTVVDSNDVVLGYSTKEDVLRRCLNYRCIQVFLFNSKDELLICKRPSTKKKFASQLGAVMGHVRRSETYEYAANREVQEETGLKIKLRRLTKFSVIDGKSRVFQEIYVGNCSDDIKPDKTEIEECSFMNIKDLKTDIVINAPKYAFPFIEAVRAYMKAMNMY